jgi:putative heme-binding domain-containing protein
MLTLGNLKTSAARSARHRMLFGNIEDKWLQIAALSASSEESPALFEQAVKQSRVQSTGWTTLFRLTSAVIGARQQPTEIDRLLARIAAADAAGAWWRTNSLEGLTQGIRTRRGSISQKGKTVLVGLFERGDAPVRHAALQALQIAGLPSGAASAIERAARIAMDDRSNPGLRADSLGLLALSNPEKHQQIFASLIDNRQPEIVQESAVRAYGKIRGDEIGRSLLEKWRTLTPAVRGDAADAMYLEPSRERLLVAALQHGDVQPWTLAFRHKLRLIMNPDPGIRDAARPILEQTPKDREAVVKQYGAALTRAGNTAKGQEVFRSVCSKCHRLNGYGSEVGPDLGTVRNQPKEALMSSILMPSQSIAQGYESYVVETNSGGNFDGVIGPQTPTTITLRHENGKEDTIQRQDIRRMYVTNLSAMPEDLEKQITAGQMADLLEYLKAAK